MSSWIKNNWEEKYTLFFVYANTGCEDPRTLDFVDKCDRWFGLNLTWVEAEVTEEKGKGTGFRVVDYAIASTDGTPFRDVISKYGLPNQNYKHCTRELKIQPILAWQRMMGIGNAPIALGIRIDEPKRIKPHVRKVYPLVHDVPMTKAEVLAFWKEQPFDLEIPEHYGNCVWCFKKSDRKLLTLAKEQPSVFDFPMQMELLFSHVGKSEGKEERKLFRGFKSSWDILQESLTFTDLYYDPNEDECAEECGTFFSEDQLDEGGLNV